MSTPKEIAVEALRSIKRVMATYEDDASACVRTIGIVYDAFEWIEAVEGEQEDSAGRADAPSATLPADPVETETGEPSVMNPVERFGWLCLAAVYFAVVVAIGHTVGVVAMADDVGLFAGMVCGMGLGVAAVLFTLLVVAAVTASISGEEP